MDIVDTTIAEVKELRTARHGDERGFFSEVYRHSFLAEHGIDVSFLQDNHARSAQAGTVRGLHLQTPPRAQGKLVRVTRGAIVDVALDVRVGSPSYGQHVAVRLSEQAWNQLWVPAGFAHGYCTLEDDTEVQYKVTDYYAPDNEAGILWCDPSLGIDWSVSTTDALVSAKDAAWPPLGQWPSPFTY